MIQNVCIGIVQRVCNVKSNKRVSRDALHLTKISFGLKFHSANYSSQIHKWKNFFSIVHKLLISLVDKKKVRDGVMT